MHLLYKLGFINIFVYCIYVKNSRSIKLTFSVLVINKNVLYTCNGIFIINVFFFVIEAVQLWKKIEIKIVTIAFVYYKQITPLHFTYSSFFFY
jgi:hypothetical protein